MDETLLIMAVILLLLPLLGIFGFFLYGFIYNIKLFFYLMKSNYSRWEGLTTLGIFGPAASNPFKWFPYLYNDLDTEDLKIRNYKKKVRFGLKFALYSLLVFAFNLVVFLMLGAMVEESMRHG